ncbi:MAG: APC family permease [Pyrinomonadaceae bacterium]
MAAVIKRLLVGRALRTEQAAHERLSKKTALAVFSSDALSSTAYATEEILLVLAVAAVATQGMSFNYVVPISVGIATLLAIVATSYRQTIHAYPSGGGAYIVAKENLGTTPGVQAFKQPEAHNVSQTLIWMAVLLTMMFLGTSVLAYFYHVHPKENETVISQFARLMFTGGMGWFYYVVQGATAAILVLAANTAFADFPRLSSLLARDRFLPRQFANRGDKLVFSNGIIILAVFSSLLVVAFAGDTSRLIPLYAVGVFLSFTLSQTGMVRQWLRERALMRSKKKEWEGETKGQATFSAEAQADAARPVPDIELENEEIHRSYFVSDEVTAPSNWKKSLVINAVGAVATFIVLCVFVATKFIHGAWIVVVVIPLLVLMFRATHKHYAGVAKQLSTEGLGPLRPIKNTVIVPISGIHRGVLNALQYAKSISPDNVQAVYVDFEEETTAKLREKWEIWGAGVQLVVLPSPYRELTRILLRYINRVERQRDDDDMITVVLPEFIPAKWWQHILHNQTSLMLKGALLFKEGVIVTSVPYHLKH